MGHNGTNPRVLVGTTVEEMFYSSGYPADDIYACQSACGVPNDKESNVTFPNRTYDSRVAELIKAGSFSQSSELQRPVEPLGRY